MFCPKHLTPENRADKASPTSHDLQNVHGKCLCHAVGCRSWKRLEWAFSGWFCQQHVQQLSYLRCCLEFSKQNSLFDDERRCRMEEASFRKIACPENMQTLLQMDKALQIPLAKAGWRLGPVSRFSSNEVPRTDRLVVPDHSQMLRVM